MKINIYRKNKKRGLVPLEVKGSLMGFTIIEVIITIFIVVVGLLAVYGVLSRVVSDINTASTRLTAAYLAQEGIEIVRNLRDRNLLYSIDPGVPWDYGLYPNSSLPSLNCTLSENPEEDRFCIADYNTSVILNPCSSITFCSGGFKTAYLRIDGNGYYYHSADQTPTKFIRKINVDRATITVYDPILEGNAEVEYLKVLVRMEWQEKGKQYNFDVSENIFRTKF